MEAKTFFSAAIVNPSGKMLLALLSCLLVVLVVLSEAAIPGIKATSLLLPLGLCAAASGALGYWAVPVLQRLKTGQVVQEDGPQTHLKKAGTPTMGGIFFVPVAIAIALVWTDFASEAVTVSLVTLAYGLIGWLDDWQVLRRQSNLGISPRTKLLLQIAIAALYCLWLAAHQPHLTSVALPGIVLSLGLFFWLLAGFVLVAESNATNLTDGVDGLAAGTGAIALLALAILVSSTASELALWCACLSGGCLGFVFHNRNPARVFMGDTGSLALGGALAAVGLTTGNLWGLFIISGIFFAESLSVIMQVGYYKATKGPDGKGKRLFRMAPLHHHLELSGWSETQVVGVFYFIGAVLAILGAVSSPNTLP